MNIEILQRAIDAAGSTKKFAQAIGISEQAVGKWKNKYQGRIPADRVQQVYLLTGVTPHELRPDLHPTPTSGIPDNTSIPQKESD
ncbi:helix-turn-helix domain-containing protein [Citrobacter cronae]|uniref:transcriptional regulator n=1 Tax=Citrobacter cronae TaxID=1748967 RepID=UPI0021D05D88|nr:helix-turn-helix domain-containing protein [Citrobacter cronae]MCU6199083.1 helix-turn-helix domain-containing protein [Citrobacter cronae]